MFNIGDLVTRNSYNNDIVFRIVKYDETNKIYYLKGIFVRLLADSKPDDLLIYSKNIVDNDEKDIISRIEKDIKLDRNDFFYLPGKVLHIDGDEDYMKRCKLYYDRFKIPSKCVVLKENEISSKITELINDYNPNIVVITGHDAYYKKYGKDNINSYKNSFNFVNAIKEARKIEMSHQKLIIIAGACQSDYEELIKAGANFASSPKRINIHALDPAIVASLMSLSDSNKDIDIKKVLDSTTKGPNGIGGIITKGTMYIGYPR